MNIKKYIKTIKNERKANFVKTAAKRKIKINVVSSEFRVLEFSNKKNKVTILNDQPNFNKKPGTLFTKNKEITKILLKKEGLSVSRGITARNYREANQKRQKAKIKYPVVVKPMDAAKGLGVTVGIGNEKELRRAIKKVRDFCGSMKMKCSGVFMIEEMEKGNDYRILVLNNKVIACVERIPAHVIGDGKSRLKDIIEKFNKKRPKAYKLVIDDEIRNLLKRNNLTINSVLKKGVRVKLRENANISSGGVSVDKTASASKRFESIAIKSSKSLGLKFSRIDIMTSDITADDPEQSYVIIEINGAPDYDIHEKPVVTGKGVNVTNILVEALMKK